MKQFYFFIAFFVTSLIFSQNFTDTKGELQISNSGTATYNLPIALPPSIKNVAPNINLTYSSGVKGGIAGQGWNINSISTLSRMATRRDIDGFMDGVDFDADDKLALDGQRLLLKTGSYWANESTYETEYKSNLKIELKIENGGASTFFIVTSPDGSRTWYGSTGSGTYQNATSVNAWYIVRFEDVNGNNIQYNYTNVVYNSKNQLYIDNITFSANQIAGIASQNQIKFIYRDAKRIERDYIKGGAVYATKILDNVQVFANNTLFRKYQLTQVVDANLGYERVSQVQEFNSQNEASNPVQFEYYSTPQTTTRTEKDYTNNLNFSETDLAGDFDGDGRLDFIADGKMFTNLFVNNSGNAGITLSTTVGRGNSFAGSTLTNSKLNQFQSVISGSNVNNSINFNVYNFINNDLQLQYAKSLDTQKDAVVRGEDREVYDDYGEHYGNYDFFNPVTATPPSYREGDFNGDGISELLIFRPTVEYHKETTVYGWNNETSYEIRAVYDSMDEDIYVVDSNPNSSTVLGSKGFVQLFFPTTIKNWASKQIADFNGDGKSDLMTINGNDNSYAIFSFKQLTVSPWVELELIGQGILDKYSPSKQMLFGDYNGDGKTDIMLPDLLGGEGQTLWHIYYSNPNPNGGEFFVKESHNIVEYWPNTGTTYSTQIHFSNYYAIDINKDGKSDIVRVWRRYYKPAWTINDHDTEWWVKGYTNNIGNTNSATTFPLTYDSKNDNISPLTGQPSGYFSDSPDIPIPLVSNYRYQGANTDLIIVRGHYHKIEYYQFNKNLETDNRLKSVTESSGNIKQTIDYLPMEANGSGLGNPASDFYSSTNSALYPNIEIVRNTESYLVSKLTATINGISKFQNFKYHGYISNFDYGTVGFIRSSRSS